SAPNFKFDLIVPAHDEENGIARTVQSLLAVDYAASLRRVIVVADNCTDRTAERARSAGAHVLERRDPSLRGKGYALDFAFQASLVDRFADAVVVIDADTVVTPNLLRALSARISSGSSAIQVGSAVSNAQASWRTALTALGFALFNGVRSLGRERLGLSCGLRGNGMCFTRELLLEHPHRACSLVEDVEQGIALGRSGIRVAFAHDAVVASCMPVTEKAARSQRQRWENGRRGMARQQAVPLLVEALKRRDGILLDLAIDLLIPPLSRIAFASAVGNAVVFAASLSQGFHFTAAWPWALSLGFLLAYVMRGWQLSALGVRGLRCLAWVPVYVFWKLTLPFRRSGRAEGEWVRTHREMGAP
ncbi:MAG: glycosyltransferase, partial [Myxococcaceae bacterium]